jgi:hypothetical protein
MFALAMTHRRPPHRQPCPRKHVARLGLLLVSMVLLPLAAQAEAPARRESAWPPGHFVNPVPGNPAIMKILEGHFERAETTVQGQFTTQTKPFWYARATASQPATKALIYLHGDVPYSDREAPDFYRSIVTRRLARYRKLARDTGVDIILLVRPGYFMAPGDTLFRQAPETLELVASAAKTLRDSLGYQTIALAGQSGGASTAAAMMMRDDLAPRCLALASGYHYREMKQQTRAARAAAKAAARTANPEAQARWQEFDANSFDIGSNLDRVRVDPRRRAFVLGDPRDGIVPFAGQARLVNELTARAHHAVLLEARARGRRHHDLASAAVDVALKCLAGAPDADIVRATADTLSARTQRGSSLND